MEEDVDIPTAPPGQKQTLETVRVAYEQRWVQRITKSPLVGDKIKEKYEELKAEADESMLEIKKNIP